MNVPQSNARRFSWSRLVIPALLFAAGVLLCTKWLRVFLMDVSSKVLQHELSRAFWEAGIFYAGEIFLLTGILLALKQFFFRGASPTGTRWFALISTGSVMALFFSHIITDAINVPIWDDYSTVLDFIIRIRETSSWQDRIGIMTEPFYESRMVLFRSFTTAWWLLTGEINFRHLILAVNACILFLFFCWLFLMFRPSMRWPASIPIALLVFQFQSYDTLLWATAGFNFVVTFLLALLAIVLVTRNKRRAWPCSILLAGAAALTYGHGWLVFAVIIAYLLYSKQGSRAAWTACLVFIMSWWYFKAQPEIPHHATAVAPWYHYPVYYFSFCGSAIRFFNRVEIAFVAGVLIHLLFWISWRRGHLNGNPVLTGMLLFLLLSAMLTTLFRTGDGGISQALSPRYGFYSQCLFLLYLTLYLQRNSWPVSGYPPAWLITVLVVWQLASAFMYYPEAVVRKNTLENFIRSWQHAGDQVPVGNPWIFGTDPIGNLNRARKAGIYKP